MPENIYQPTSDMVAQENTLPNDENVGFGILLILHQKQLKSRIQKLPSIEEIRKSVPKSCFEKPLKKSMSYFLLDIAILTVLYLAVPFLERSWIGLMIWFD